MIRIFKELRAFTLPQLLVALLLSAIVVLAVYRYMIKGLGTMSESTKLSIMMRNATVAINGMATDMKMIGYNPSAEINSGNYPLYGLQYHGTNEQIRYSLFKPPLTPTSPVCTCSTNEIEATCPRNSLDPQISCCCERYSMKGYDLVKEYYDQATSSKAMMTLVNNACVRFILWDSENDIPCACQSSTGFRKCQDTDLSGSCSPGDANNPPRMIKIILAVVPKSYYAGASNFDSECRSKLLKPDQYVRLERKVYLANYK